MKLFSFNTDVNNLLNWLVKHEKANTFLQRHEQLFRVQFKSDRVQQERIFFFFFFKDSYFHWVKCNNNGCLTNFILMCYTVVVVVSEKCSQMINLWYQTEIEIVNNEF